ncbi:MAG: ATP-grasp domain-containing protein [Methanoregulaceae archaeon]|nr:ATP-grasp domain-containing protein [Methanoregulaceae archaeon]
MRALLAEYARYHDPVLAPEGEAMYSVLKASFRATGFEVVSPEEGDFASEIRRLAPVCDIGLVIAPDHLLPGFTRTLEETTHNIGCGSMSAAVCANKRLTGRTLAAHGIAVPDEVETGLRVIKPVSGCGSQGVVLSDRKALDGEISQKYIEGEHLSVSLVGSRVVGNVCEYYTGKTPLLLAINRQYIELTPDGKFRYQGGETPVDHDRKDEIVKTAISVVNVLGCQGYTGVDVVVADKVYVVDVNPRITTSIVGIAACIEGEIAEILVSASRGGGPEAVKANRRVRYDHAGRVRPV